MVQLAPIVLVFGTDNTAAASVAEDLRGILAEFHTNWLDEDCEWEWDVRYIDGASKRLRANEVGLWCLVQRGTVSGALIDAPLQARSYKQGTTVLVLPASHTAIQHYNQFVQDHNIVRVVAILDEADAGQTHLLRPADVAAGRARVNLRERQLALLCSVPPVTGAGSRLYSKILVRVWHTAA